VLDWEQWDDKTREGFARLKKEGFDLPPESEEERTKRLPSLEDLLRKDKETKS
jgi:hypothetical protein